MAALAEAFVRIRPDTSTFKNDLTSDLRKHKPAATRTGVSLGQSLGGGMRVGVSKSVSGIGKMLVAGFAAIKVGGFLKGAITAASDLSETVNKSNVIFGKNAGVVQAWSKTAARSFGLTKNEALGAAASFGDMFQQLGIGGAQATKMSTGVVKLAADLGSFNNLPTAEVLDMISAGFRGEYDSLQRVIPNINAARVQQEALRMTHKKSVQDLTAAEKATATLAIIQKDGSRAAGDFARTSGGLANQQKILSAQFGDFKTSVGAVALPVVTKFFSFLNTVAIPVITRAAAVIKGGFTDGLQGNTGLLGVLERVGNAVRAVVDAFEYGPIKAFQAGFRGLIYEDMTRADQVFARLGQTVQKLGMFLRDDVIPQVAHFVDFLVRNRETLIPLVAAVATMVGIIKVYILVTKLAAAAQILWNIAVAANPIGVIVVLIAGLVVAVITAYRTSDKFRSIVQAAWRGIKVAAEVTWAALKVIFAAIAGAFATVGRAAKALWEVVLRPIFKFIIGAWLTVATAIVNGAAKAFGWVPGIGAKLRTAAAEFNKFAGKVNAALDSTTKPRTVNITARLKALGITPRTTAGLQSGGKLPGYGGGDIVPAMLEPGEAVVPKHLVPEMSSWAKQRGIPGFARGGVAGGLQVSPHLSGAARFDAAIAAFNRRVDDITVALAKTFGGLGRVVNFAKSQAGKPYVWGAAGPGGYDCSGFVSNLVEVAKGLPLYRRLFATGSMGSYPWRGQFGKQFQVGWTTNAGGGIGHTAATVNGVPMESRGGDGVVVGSRSRGANQSIFNRHAFLARGGIVLPGDPPFDLLDPRGRYFQPGLLEALRTAKTFDTGGWLRPGQVGINRSSRPERIRSGAQEDALLAEMRAIRKAIQRAPLVRPDERWMRRTVNTGNVRSPGNGW